VKIKPYQYPGCLIDTIVDSAVLPVCDDDAETFQPELGIYKANTREEIIISAAWRGTQ
jgi:hypothetical protein